MAKTLIMNDTRPDGAGGFHRKGQTYTLADDLAHYYLSNGIARYPTLQQLDVVADRDPATGAVSTVGTGRDPLGTPVVAVTGPGGVVYFLEMPLQTNTVPAGFRPSILASLVTGATYSQVGTTVTVTATNHGLPTNRNGYRIFFPGAGAVPVGWYENFSYVDANTFTFKNPTEQTIAAGTAITGTLPYTTTTTVAAQVMPGGSMGSSGVLMAKIIAGGDATAGTKTTRLAINSAITSSANHAATSMSSFTLTVANVDYAKQVGVGAQDGVNTATDTQITTQDTSVDFTASITGKLTNASQWRAYDSVIFSALALP